ncbi:MAG: hypothetical protein ACRCYY_05840 [Trueperaceae bacterium]
MKNSDGKLRKPSRLLQHILISLALFISLIMMMLACSGSSSETSPAETSEETTDEKRTDGTEPVVVNSEELKRIAEASLAANIRKGHPHESSKDDLAADDESPSPFVSPGNAFTQGIPGDDIEQTALYSIGSITGESGGFDIFNAVNPADAQPGQGLITAFYSGTNGGERDMPGDRFLLGDHNQAYYLGRTGDVDNDFARMLELETREGNEVVLHGSPSDYVMVETGGDEPGTAIFYNNQGVYDMVGFLDIQIKTDVNDPIYRYVSSEDTPSATPILSRQLDQFGTPAADLITAIDVDAGGNIYVTGVSRGNLAGIFPNGGGGGQLFAAKYAATGERVWLTQFGSAEQIADLAWDMTLDARAMYIAARYIAPESQRGGQKESAYFKLDLTSGNILKEEVWGGVSVQYAGTVALDNADHVYFAGIGYDTTNPNPDGKQDPYIEKRNRSDLSLVKREIFGGDKDNVEGSGGAKNKEPWGGLTFVPKAGGAAGEGTIYTSGWTQGSYEGTTAAGGGDVWLVAFDQDLNELWYEGWGSNQRDWAWDMDVDSQGFIYVTGLTLGAMAGSGSSQGMSDGFVTKLDPSKPAGQRVVWTKQFGTALNDELRKIKVVDDAIYVSGHTYGDLGTTNAGQSDIWISKLDLNGSELATFQAGTPEDDRAMLSANANGVYVGGYTFGSFVKPTAGFMDAFVLKLVSNLD